MLVGARGNFHVFITAHVVTCWSDRLEVGVVRSPHLDWNLLVALPFHQHVPNQHPPMLEFHFEEVVEFDLNHPMVLKLSSHQTEFDLSLPLLLPLRQSSEELDASAMNFCLAFT